ncbi:MAG TPA: AraC family transcriptional regulator, partial [bacterium]|nr:AraC family transcriptional regulator [bacterium]
GESVAPGQSLGESYRQAVRALHLRRDRDKDLVFFAPGLVEKAEGVAELDRLLADLRRRFESGAFSRLGEAVDAFLNQVLTLSFQSPEEIRWHLHYALREAGEALRNRSDLEEADFTRMARALSQAVEQAATRQEMVLAFQDGLEKLVGLSRNPGRTGDLYSLEKVRRHLERNFQSPLNLARLARLAGVSPSTLSRRFKAAHGAGLETYLQDLRLQEARRLLSGGSLPLSQVARACGFKSPSYFVRFFTRKTRQSPGQYRKRAKPS